MNIQETATKIKSMEIRGAGNIGRAAASALKDLALQSSDMAPEMFQELLNDGVETLTNTRPTAVTLTNALTAVMAGAKGGTIEELKCGVIAAADRFIAHSIEAIDKITDLCAARIQDGATILTHCNSSVVVKSIIKAHDQGKNIKVFATETRPWGQGYITSRALAEAGVDVTLIVDSAARTFMAETDLVIFGADTITGNGTVINKIGTSQIALCARERSVPVLVCAETYKFAMDMDSADSVIIEERDKKEIIDPDKMQGVKIRNPVFDRTPPELIDTIITELGAVSPAKAKELIESEN